VEPRLPADIRERMSLAWRHRFALNRSYVAFSDRSADGDPGNGEAQDGDPVGFMNRGLDSEILADEPGRYEARIFWYAEPDRVPVTVDVTPRRVQGMTWKPGDVLDAVIADTTGAELSRQEVKADDLGLATVTRVEVRSREGCRLTLRRK
jgi:hypothetical protein